MARCASSGSAGGATVVAWTLELRPAGGTEWQTLGQGAGGAIAAALDGGRLANGLYELRLTVTDTAGRKVSATSYVTVAGASRMGAYQQTVVDLEVLDPPPAAPGGAPLRLTRVYDSRAGQSGDFGTGVVAGLRGRPGRGRRPAGPGLGGEPRRGRVLPTPDTGARRPGHPPGRAGGPLPPRGGEPLRRGGAPGDRQPGLRAPGGPGRGRRRHGGRPGAVTLAPPGEVYVNRLVVPGAEGASAPATVPAELLDFNTAAPLDPERYEVTIAGGARLTMRRGGGVERIIDQAGQGLAVDRVGITRSTGARIRFERDGQGRIARAFDLRGNAVRYVYDTAGRLRTVVDREGNSTTYTYTEAGQLSAEVDPLGVTVARLEYDSDGRLEGITDGAGQRTSYRYNPEARQRTTIDRRGGTTVETFDPLGRLTARRDQEGREVPLAPAASGPAPGGAPTAAPVHPAAALPDLVALSRPGAGGPPGQSQSQAPAQETLDRNGRVVQRSAGNDVTRYTYDAAGRMTAQTGGPGGEVTYSYDALGRLVEARAADGAVRRWYYDPEGSVVAAVGAGGRVTQFAYDRSQRLIQVTHPDGGTERREYDGAGRLVRSFDRAGQATTYVYDGAGRLAQTVDPLGGATRREYDPAGNLTALVDPAGRATRYEYEPDPAAPGRLRLRQTILPDGSPQPATAGAGGAQAPRPAERTLPDGTRLRLEYDPAGRVVAEVDPAGRRTAFAYDPEGRLLDVTLPTGATESLTYDLEGRPDTLTTAAGDLFLYRYDRQGRLLERTFPDGSSESYEYAADGLLERTTGAWGTTRYERDTASGRLARLTLPDGRYVRYEYDSRGQPLSVAHAAVAGAPETVTRYAYDAAGRVVSVSSDEGTFRLRYDSAGRREGGGAPQRRHQQLPLRRPRPGHRGGAPRPRRSPAGHLRPRRRPRRRRSPGATRRAGQGAPDRAGNRSEVGGQRLVYDSAARLVRLEPPGQASVAYTFGPNGWRQSRSDARGTVYYLFDERPLPGDVAGGRVLRESDRSGVVLREYVYLPEDPLPAGLDGGREGHLPPGRRRRVGTPAHRPGRKRPRPLRRSSRPAGFRPRLPGLTAPPRPGERPPLLARPALGRGRDPAGGPRRAGDRSAGRGSGQPPHGVAHNSHPLPIP